MSLRIAKFDTTCHVPPRHRSGADAVDRLARGRFARDLGQHLGPSLARQPAIVRIRRLPLRVIIPASELNEDALSLAWRKAFGKALFTALAYPSGVGPFEVFRAESVASFIASAIHDLLDGTAPTKWQYAEFEEIFRQGSTQAALTLICEWPHQSMAILFELAQRGVLDRLLARFDDLAMERISSALTVSVELVAESLSVDVEAKPLSVADLVAAATLALTHLPQKAIALRTRAYALSLFVEGRRGRQPVRSSPRALFHALVALAVMLNEEMFWPGIPHGELWSQRLPSDVTALLRNIITQVSDGRSQPPQLAELNAVLITLRSELKVPLPYVRPAEVRWILSDWCGLFFLTGTLSRLGWIPAWRQLADFQVGGVACLVAGLAVAITGKFDTSVPAMDPGLALFAGYLGDPAIAHLHKVFQKFPREVRLQVLQAALPHDQADDEAENWAATFDRLAEALLLDFASRIRGFRQATRQAIVRSFIARPGRIRIEPDRIVVLPSPTPFYVALHISGIDTPVEEVSWLDGRRLEFELGDL